MSFCTLFTTVFSQCRHQQLQLAALALLANPALLGLAELALAVKHYEARCGDGCVSTLNVRWIKRIECLDLRHRAVQQIAVVRHLSRWRISPISQQCKLSIAFGVGQVVQLQPVCQVKGGAWPGQHARNHHHHPMRRRNAPGKCQAGQMLRPCRLADQPVDHRHHRLGCREHHQQRPQKRQPKRRIGTDQPLAVTGHEPTHQASRAQKNCAQVAGQGEWAQLSA